MTGCDKAQGCAPRVKKHGPSLTLRTVLEIWSKAVWQSAIHERLKPTSWLHALERSEADNAEGPQMALTRVVTSSARASSPMLLCSASSPGHIRTSCLATLVERLTRLTAPNDEIIEI